MYVRPAWRHRGYGRLLLSALEDTAPAATRRIVLETGARNTAALALYRAAGYLPTSAYVRGRDPAINRALAKRLA